MSGEPTTGSALPQTFKKAERLTSNKIIDELYSKGSSFVLYPFRVSYLFHDAEVPSKVQVLITVPKSKFKLAVHRNRIKRLMREAYRKHKHLCYEFVSTKKQNLSLAFVFIEKELPDYTLIEKKMIAALTGLIKK